jgi:sortase (surface protein transpeptidase)
MSARRIIRRPVAVAAAAAGLVIAAIAVGGFAFSAQTGRPALRPTLPQHHSALPPIPMGKVAAAPPAQAQQVARPVRLAIPAINVRTRLIRLGVTRSGAMQVPATTKVAGWFTGSPRPGAPGGAIIAGHIDSYLGPGIFHDLSAMQRGMRVYVRRADGTTAEFRVTSVRSYLKTKFPRRLVYGPTPNAQLRLITCGGTFDHATGHYLSNTIVYATLISK